MVRWASGVTMIRLRPVGGAAVAGPAAEAGHPGDAVAHGAAGHLDTGAHGCVELLGPVGLDEGHRALDQPLDLEERVVCVGQDVDERVADADDVQGGRLSHGGRGYSAAPPSGAPPGTVARPARTDPPARDPP